MRIAFILFVTVAAILLNSEADAQTSWRNRGRERPRVRWLQRRIRPATVTAAPWSDSAVDDATPDDDASGPRVLFNGTDLTGWKVITEFDFERRGKVSVEDGVIVLEAGTPATGIRFDGDFPRMSYEVTLDAKRVKGSDFFCGITFPVGDDYLSLVLGGWGGGTTGISNLDGMSAVENTTTGFQEFEQDHWYQVRLAVTNEKVEVWIDKEQIVDVDHEEHKLSIWWEQEPVRPFGIASWYTKSALRNITLRRLAE